jgi:ATP-dependent Clp protease protease subunit
MHRSAAWLVFLIASSATLDAHAAARRASRLTPIAAETPAPAKAPQPLEALLKLAATAKPADRTIYIGAPIDSALVAAVTGRLLHLDELDPKRPITMYINSPGGEVYSGMAIYDMMQHINAPVHTIAIGHSMSMGAVLLAGGAKGMRAATPNARIMIHQPSGGHTGNADHIRVMAEEMDYINRKLAEVLARDTGRTLEEVLKDLGHDKYMSAEEALKYRLIDRILVGKRPIEPTPTATPAASPEAPRQ